MVKTHTTLTVDPDLLTRAKQIGVNLSGEFNDFLALKIAKNTQNFEKIDLILEKKRLKQVEKQLEILKIEQKSILDTIEMVEKEVEEREKKALEEEKKLLEEQKICMICGFVINENDQKEQTNTGGFVHANPSKYDCIEKAYKKGLI